MLVAKRVSDNAEVVATEVDRGPEYRCPDPECNQVIFIRKGRKRIHHFAHQRDAACAYGRGETQAHLSAKLLLRDEFRRRGYQADVERVVLSDESDRRADVLVSKPNTDRRMAIEVQHSNLSVLDIERRTKAYMAAGVPVIWIGLINWSLLEIGDRSLNGYYVTNYRSRDWEKWAHDYNGNHLWLLDVNVSGGRMWRAWWSGSSTILEGPFELQSLHVKFYRRTQTLHGRKIPVAYGAWLLAPNEDKPPSLPIPKGSMVPPPALPPLWRPQVWWRTKRSRGGPRL